MSDVTLYGVGASSYVRTCRLALEEKSVTYDHVENMPQSPEQLAVHPFGKVPAFKHGDVHLFETMAICSYVDRAFDGPSLQPADAPGRARMHQWCSAFCDNIYGPMVLDIIIQRVVIPMRGGTTDEAIVAAGAKKAEAHLKILEAALTGNDYFAGDSYSLADMFYLPTISNMQKMPEGALLEATPNVNAWFERCKSRPACVTVGI